MTRVAGKFSWKAVTCTSLVTTAILACAILLPWARLTLAEARAEKLSAIYSSGLLPCGTATADDFTAFIQKYQPEKPIIEIREFPTLLNEAHVIQITAEHVYSIDFKSLYKANSGAVAELNTEVAPGIAVAGISPGTRQELTALLSADIRNAQAREDFPIDGTAYVFRVPAAGCAHTHSPGEASRAAKLVSLYYFLRRHATVSNASALEESSNDILVLVRSLKAE